jgi:hypothetical protein
MQPNNGCLCNHVPGTLQIGDRSDILGIRAPAPVMIIGATNDTEFPPDAMKRTGEKVRKLYDVVGAGDNTRCQIFEAGHGYDKAMREAAMGFFDKHLRGKGDGSPVPEPALTLEKTEDLRCMTAEPPADAKTMRDITRERLANASPNSFDAVVRLNGGLPQAVPLNVRIGGERADEQHRRVIFTFDSERGLTIPAVIHFPPKPATAAVVLVSEAGKVAAPTQFGVERLMNAGIACICIDARGCGELADLNPHFMAYLGTAQSFAMGWDATRAVAALRELPASAALSAKTVGVAGRGAAASQAALFAGLISPDVSFVAGFDSLRDYAECLEAGVSTAAIQPRAANSARLADLRAALKAPAFWQFRGEPADAAESIQALASRAAR